MSEIVKKSKAGRPKLALKKLRVSFTMSPAMSDKVYELARKNKSSVSSIIETLLEQCPNDFLVKPKRSYNRKEDLHK